MFISLNIKIVELHKISRQFKKYIYNICLRIQSFHLYTFGVFDKDKDSNN